MLIADTESDMRNRAISAVLIVGMVLVSGDVWSEELERVMPGYGPEIFDWSAGWLGSVLNAVFTLSALVVTIGIAILLRRWIGSRHRVALSRRQRALPGSP